MAAVIGRVASPLHRLLSLIAAYRSPSQLSRLLPKILNQTNNYRSLQLMINNGRGIWFRGVASAPPYSKPNPSRLGFFTSVFSPRCAGIPPILRVPQAISRRPESAHRPGKFDSFLVSVLKKSARTSPAEHTQKPFRDKWLPLMRRIGFDAWITYCNSRTR
jgi:hypothetical protein